MRPLTVLVGLLLLFRLPFLDHPIQGDDVNYLAAAQHAQIDPLHPHHARYVFLGQWVDMRGHPHPPLNAWILGALLALNGDIQEIPFHAAYVVFSMIAAAAMWSLARRFSVRPLWASLLFLATPAFVVSGNSLEADVPFLAFWTAAIALWVRAVDGRSTALLLGAVTGLALASLAAYQAIAAIPILAFYTWQRARGWRRAWAALSAPAVTIGAFQLWEWLGSGLLPASVLAGYFRTYGLQALGNKVSNAAALGAHLAWVVSPLLLVIAFRAAGRWRLALALIASAAALAVDPHPLFWVSLGLGVLMLVSLVRRQAPDELFLAAWVLVFFAAALALFFAGSARYLLPLAAPVAILAANRCDRRWLAAGLVLHVGLGLALSAVNFSHWDGYRRFVRSLGGEFGARRVWINGEWFRYYGESEGGLALERGQAVRPGEMVLSSRLAFPVPFTTGGGFRTTLAERVIQPSLPFRLLGVEARSAWSTASLGLRPFDLGTAPVDVVRAEIVLEREPALSWLPMNAPEASAQIVSGVHELEAASWRWTSGRAVILLKSPPAAAPLRVEFHIPASSPARRVSMSVDGRVVATGDYAPGTHTLSSPPEKPAGASTTVVITVDKTFQVGGDHRALGVVLSALGFR